MKRKKTSFEGRPLEHFLFAFGVFMITFTVIKLFFARRLFFQTTFLGFYFGSIVLWWIYFINEILEWRVWKRKSK